MIRFFMRKVITAVLLGLCMIVVADTLPARKTTVKTGLDHLKEKATDKLKGKRIALIVNHSSIDSRGKHIIDILHPKYKVVKIFAPEHGVRGKVDEHVGNSKDAKTGVPIISLYQRKKKAPSREDLADVDVIIFDIQEIGVRYYTYASTMVMAMKAAKESGKRMLILDRPNMAGSLGVYGPLLESKFHGGFAGYYPIPITHAMTIGELARYYNEKFRVGADIEVIQLSGYRHSMFYDETGLPWRNPSPNINGMTAVLGYHILGALETLNISVGRGTRRPFQLYGAPFFNATKLTRRLNAAKLPGIKFRAVTFRPEKSVYRKKVCKGFRIMITNRRKVDPMRTLITVAREIYKDLPKETRDRNWQSIANAVGDTDFILRIAKGDTTQQLLHKIASDLNSFARTRKEYLLYP
jgi:uncharacterized protein YbbC (DUF1343 family)